MLIVEVVLHDLVVFLDLVVALLRHEWKRWAHLSWYFGWHVCLYHVRLDRNFRPFDHALA